MSVGQSSFVARRSETTGPVARFCPGRPASPRRAVASCLSAMLLSIPGLIGCGHAGPAREQTPAATPSPEIKRTAKDGVLQHTRDVPSAAYEAYCRGRLAAANEDWQRAVKAFGLALSIDPDADRAYADLLHCCDKLGDFKRALPALATWSKRNPNVFRVRAETGLYLDRWGLRNRAVAELEAATKCEIAEEDRPLYHRALQRLAALYLSDGELGRALWCYEQMRTTDQVPEAAIEFKIGEAFFELGAYDRAAKHFEAARTYGPTHAPVLRYLTFCYDETKRYEHAIAAAKSFLAVEKPGASWPVQNQLANLYEKTLQFDKAAATRGLVMKTLAERIEGGSENLLEYIHQSQLLRSAQRYNDAISVLKEADSLAAGSTPRHLRSAYHLALAEAYYDSKDDSNVEKELRKALELDPERHEASNFLGYFYAERGTHLQEAERLIGQALRQDPKNGAYLDSLGWVYYQQATANKDRAKLEEALKKLKQAAALADDPVIRDHIGDVYRALGNLEEAEHHWELALALWKSRPFATPGPEPVERKLKTLRERRGSPDTTHRH